MILVKNEEENQIILNLQEILVGYALDFVKFFANFNDFVDNFCLFFHQISM